MPFYDTVESPFYSWCVERFLDSAVLRPYVVDGVVEMGAGTGIPLLDAISRCESKIQVRGFERDLASFRAARRLVERKAPGNYTVEFGDFFEHARDAPERCVVANPPYLPAPEGSTDAPELCGGERGGNVAQRILSGSFDVVMLMVSSISDPLGVLAEATRHGYRVRDWAVRPIEFGRYSREPKVWERIHSLAASGGAFFRPGGYLLAGITWVRDEGAPVERPGADAEVVGRVLSIGAGVVTT